MTTVTVCVPSIPPRQAYRERALRSVAAQTRRPDEVAVVIDEDGEGASATRNRAWRLATSEWVAFLDDDDELHPHHLETLLAHSDDADLIYPWFDLPRGSDPLYVHRDGQLVPAFGVPFGDEQRDYVMNVGNFIPVTVLVKRALLEEVDGFPRTLSERWQHDQCEDWGCWQDLLRAGARFKHVPERTWTWHWHGLNTSGKPWKVT